MPKTKDAFALRGFDEKRILQRPWFKKLNLPVGYDEDVLLGFYNVFEKPIKGITLSGFLKILSHTDEGYLTGAIENSNTITLLAARAAEYLVFIQRHVTQLLKMQNYYTEKFMLTNETIYKEKFKRVHVLLNCYNQILSTNLMTRISSTAKILEELLKKIFQERFFGSRLKQARKQAGLTQKTVAEKLGITRNAYTLYENGKRDIPTLTLAKLSILLNQPTDWLLGIKN